MGVGPRARGPTSKTTPPAQQQGTQPRQKRNKHNNCFVFILVVFLAVVWAVWVWVWDRARARPHIENHTASTTARNTIKTETNQKLKLFCLYIGCVPCCGAGGLGLGVGPRARGPTSKTTPPTPQQRPPPRQRITQRQQDTRDRADRVRPKGRSSGSKGKSNIGVKVLICFCSKYIKSEKKTNDLFVL